MVLEKNRILSTLTILALVSFILIPLVPTDSASASSEYDPDVYTNSGSFAFGGSPSYSKNPLTTVVVDGDTIHVNYHGDKASDHISHTHSTKIGPITASCPVGNGLIIVQEKYEEDWITIYTAPIQTCDIEVDCNEQYRVVVARLYTYSHTEIIGNTYSDWDYVGLVALGPWYMLFKGAPKDVTSTTYDHVYYVEYYEIETKSDKTLLYIGGGISASVIGLLAIRKIFF